MEQLAAARYFDKTPSHYEEDHLREEPLAGDVTLTLQAAQAIIATDWFKYYKEKILK